MEEYDYEIEHMKGKENTVADCLSRLFPVQEEDLSQQALENIDLLPEAERLEADNTSGNSPRFKTKYLESGTIVR